MVDNTKQHVRKFYDHIGWSHISEGRYQNVHYEDVRPVSRDYIHLSHLRINRHLKPTGRFLLDAGSGPVQYPEYLTYSAGYSYRVCLDISIQALKDARERLSDHGLYVVADIANLPFKSETFDGIISLHTIHHLPTDEHCQAYLDLYRVLRHGANAVVVNGWTNPPLRRIITPIVRLGKAIRFTLKGKRFRLIKRKKAWQPDDPDLTKTFTYKTDALWLKRELTGLIPFEIYVWRSVNVHFLRTFIHPWLGGRYLLRVLYFLEERFPYFFGENGQYPLIVLRKTR